MRSILPITNFPQREFQRILDILLFYKKNSDFNGIKIICIPFFSGSKHATAALIVKQVLLLFFVCLFLFVFPSQSVYL